MKMKSLATLFSVFVLLFVFSAAVHAVPVTIDRVEVNGDQVVVNDSNRLDLVRGQDLDVKVKLSATGNGSDLEVHGFVSGFEFNRDMPISDVTPVFSVESGVSYVKHLRLRISDLTEEDNYLLRILVTDRSGTELIQNYRLKLDVPRHSLTIRDVVMNPDATVVSGRALLVTVRVKNMGEQDEEGIKIKAAIPELGISASDFIDKLKADESTTSEELYLRIPSCAKSGDYTLKVSVEYNEGFDHVYATKTISVDSADSCAGGGTVGGETSGTDTGSGTGTGKGRVIITVASEPPVLVAGGAGAVYPISVSNLGSTTKTFTFTTEGVDDWGSVRVSPSNVVAARGGEVKSATLFVTANKDAAAGERMFTLNVKDQAGNVLEQIVLKANVQGQKGSEVQLGGMRKYLEIGLILLVVLLVIIAIVVLLSRLMKGKEDEEEPESKTYY